VNGVPLPDVGSTMVLPKTMSVNSTTIPPNAKRQIAFVLVLHTCTYEKEICSQLVDVHVRKQSMRFLKLHLQQKTRKAFHGKCLIMENVNG